MSNRIPKRVKKWKKKIYGGHATVKLKIPNKPSWFWMLPEKKFKGRTTIQRIMRRYIRAFNDNRKLN